MGSDEAHEADAVREQGGRMDEAAIERESMEFDVVIVGADPSGLAAAVRLRQLPEGGAMLSACTPPEGVVIELHNIHGITRSARGP